MYSALAYCNLQLKNPEQARILGKRAKEYAGTLSEQQRASEFLEYLDRLENYNKTPAGAPAVALRGNVSNR